MKRLLTHIGTYVLGGVTAIFGCVILGLFKEERSYEVKFVKDSLLYYDEKIEQTETNSLYAAAEYQYMTMYSYPTDVVFVGDSITYKCQWNELYPDKSIKNRGIGSDTTSGLLTRIDSIIKTQPDKLFIMIGINDLSIGINEDVTIENYREIVSRLQNELPNAEIFVQSILPVEKEKGIDIQKIKGLNNKLQSMCEEFHIEYINLYDKFSNDEGFLIEEYSYDGVHLSSNGYEVWKNILDSYIYE